MRAIPRNAHDLEEVPRPTRKDIKAVEEFLDTVSDQIELLHNLTRTHPPFARVGIRAITLAGVLNAMCERTMTLKNIAATGNSLPKAVLKRYGLTGKETYKQYTHTNQRIADVLKEERTREALGIFFDADDPDDGTTRTNGISLFATALLNEQCKPVLHIFNGLYGVDGTVVMTRAKEHWRDPTEEEQSKRPKKNRDKKVCFSPVDRDAAYGHYPNKDGNVEFALGYEFELLGPAAEGDQPLLAIGIAFQPNSTKYRDAARNLAIRLNSQIVQLMYDGGYDFVGARSFAEQLRAHGIGRTFDPVGRPRRAGSHSGAILIDGDAFCPFTPEKIQEPAPSSATGRSAENAAKLNAKYDERQSYQFERRGQNQTHYRSMCPAESGKVECPRKPSDPNKVRDHSKPTIELGKEADVPEENWPKCCTQKTIGVPVTLLGPNRQDRNAYGTTAWNKEYKQRNMIESVNGAIRENNHGGLAERKWTKVMGLEKVGLMFTFKAIASNIFELAKFDFD